MTSYRLDRTTVIPASLNSVFEFFRNPRNLETLTPAWLGFRILFTSDDTVRRGTRIRYRLRIAGIPLSWESRITEYENGLHFADEQIVGPYKQWYHRHTFRTVPAGVEMTDAVDYVLPFGPLGRLSHWLIVRHLLRAIFDYRTAIITERFGAARPSASLQSDDAIPHL